ncbi:MAG: hypothetical protein AAF587_15140 [Bacteroidota bacterium]
MTRKPEELFEAVRKLPPELSREQVAKIIIGLPALPVPSLPISGGSWTQFFTFNPLIMNSIIISLVVGVAVLLPQKDQPTIAQEPDIQPTQVQEQVFAPQQIAATRPILPLLPPKTIDTQHTKHIPAEKPAFSHPPSPLTIKASDSLVPPPDTKHIAASVLAVAPFSFPHIQTMPAVRSLRVPTAQHMIEDLPPFSSLQAKRLKRKLLIMLKEDGLIRSRREFVKIELFPNMTRVKELILAGRIQQKYLRFFDQHDIYPSPGRYVILHPKCIMIGNFSGNGFHGMAHGTIDDEIQEYLDRITPLQSQSPRTSILFPTEGQEEVISVLATPSSTTIEPVMSMPVHVQGQLLEPIVQVVAPIETEPVSVLLPEIDIQGHLSGSEPLFIDSETVVIPSGALLENDHQSVVVATPSSREITHIHGTVTVQGEGRNDLPRIPPIRSIEGNIWAQLKAELLENLLADGLISRVSSPVKLSYAHDDIIVNRINLSRDLYYKYLDILRKYPVRSGPQSEIHITPEFLLAGEFDRDGYLLRGHGHGDQEVDEERGVIGIQEEY